MPSLADIRKRIRSVRSSQKITSAMKLVAASKLKRAQDAMTAARPFALEMEGLLRRLRATLAEQPGGVVHPLLENRPRQRVLVVVITSDRGSCGAFNANVIRASERFVRNNAPRLAYLEIMTIGRKGRDHFRKRRLVPMRDLPGVYDDLTPGRAQAIVAELTGAFVAGQFDAVHLIYNAFVTAITQRVTVCNLLPVVAEESPAGADASRVDYIYEPSPGAVLGMLLPRYVSAIVWRALLESVAAEHGARMAAMDSATKNAKELIDVLTLQYNRARQAAITRELMEIIGGAEALSS